MKSLKIQKGHQKPYIEEEKTIQWPKEKVEKDTHQMYKTLHIKLHSTFATPSKHCIIQVLFYGMHYM